MAPRPSCHRLPPSPPPGPRLAWAVALAADVLAMGESGPAWVAGFDAHGSLALRADGLVARTGTLDCLRARRGR